MTKLDSLFEDYNKLLAIVLPYFQVNEDKILHCNEEDSVIARYCIIFTLCEQYGDRDISKVCKLSKSCVNKIRNNMRYKMSDPSFKCHYSRVKSIMDKQ